MLVLSCATTPHAPRSSLPVSPRPSRPTPPRFNQQCIYDLKFPCGYAVGSNPWSNDVAMQMESYGHLGGECAPALITPQRGIVRE